MKLLVSLLVGAALMAACPAYAKPKQRDLAPPTDADNVCAIYGAGYHRVPGTDTCIKVGGYISAEAGVSSGASKSENSSH